MHSPPIDDDLVLNALAEADPARGLGVTDEAARRLVRASLRAGVGTGRPRQRLAALIVGVVAVLGVGVPGVALAAGYLAQTGWFGSPNPGSPDGTEPIGTEADASEWVDVMAPDYVDFAVSVWPDYATLPPGYDTASFAAAISRAYVASEAAQNDGLGSLRQVTGIRSEFEQFARCAWRAEWLNANDAGDASRQSAAAGTLVGAATWPATVASDGGGIVDEERAVGDAASSGDRLAVESLNPWCSVMLERVTE